MDSLFSIVRREEWKATLPKSNVVNMYPPNKFISAVWTDTEPCHTHEECLKAVRDIQKEHVSSGLPDIAYNFLVADDGRVYEGRGWLKQPSPNKTFPELDGISLKIGLIGKDKSTTDRAKTDLIDKLLDWGKQQGFVTETTGYFPEYDGGQPEPGSIRSP